MEPRDQSLLQIWIERLSPSPKHCHVCVFWLKTFQRKVNRASQRKGMPSCVMRKAREYCSERAYFYWYWTRSTWWHIVQISILKNLYPFDNTLNQTIPNRISLIRWYLIHLSLLSWGLATLFLVLVSNFFPWTLNEYFSADDPLKAQLLNVFEVCIYMIFQTFLWACHDAVLLLKGGKRLHSRI